LKFEFVGRNGFDESTDKSMKSAELGKFTFYVRNQERWVGDKFWRGHGGYQEFT
jgi:hypothetical protein